KGFKTGLNIELKPLQLNDLQHKEIKELEHKYRSDEWMYRK
ncbi:octanoyltransferase, partial [Staphylococcus saccharolyticus]